MALLHSQGSPYAWDHQAKGLSCLFVLLRHVWRRPRCALTTISMTLEALLFERELHRVTSFLKGPL